MKIIIIGDIDKVGWLEARNDYEDLILNDGANIPRYYDGVAVTVFSSGDMRTITYTDIRNEENEN